MASEILGLFTSPEMYRQQRDLMMQQQAAQLAQLDPYQSINYGAIRAGQQFGRGLAGLLGGEDPQLRLISARQSALSGLDLSSPDAIMSAARQLAESGDQQGALALADYGRKALSEKALAEQRMQERAAATQPKELVLANSRAALLQQRRMIEALPEDAPNRAQALQLIDDTLSGLPVSAEAIPKFGEKVEVKSFELFNRPYSKLTIDERKQVNDTLRLEDAKSAKEISFGEDREAKSFELYATSYSQLTPEQRAKVNSAIAKPAKEPAYGVDREAEAMARYGKRFGDLTQTQQVAVNKAVDAQAEKVAPRFTMTGQNEPIDIPKLRKSLTDSLEPYKSTIDAGDSAISLLTQAKANKNASSFNSGITELARMTQGGRLSNKDVELAKVDPAVLRRASDFVSTTFQGVPTESTINDIINTVKLLRKVAADKYAREVNTQRKIASKAKIDQETIDILFEDTTLPAAPKGGGKPVVGKTKSGITYTVTED